VSATAPVLYCSWTVYPPGFRAVLAFDGCAGTVVFRAVGPRWGVQGCVGVTASLGQAGLIGCGNVRGHGKWRSQVREGRRRNKGGRALGRRDGYVGDVV